MKLVDRFLESPLAYSLWQAPFAGRKFAPIAARVDVSGASRVLDVGCGPGTNRRRFSHASYVGIDLNSRYVRRARARAGGSYVVADVANLPLGQSASFDFILVNSLLHHIPTSEVEGLLDQLAGLLAPVGRIHVLDLVLARRGATARLLAKHDRGSYPRPWDDWMALLSRRFQPVVAEGYSIDLLGLPLWHMIYFQGRTE